MIFRIFYKKTIIIIYFLNIYLENIDKKYIEN
jgi:hypothetical protein